MKRKAALLDLFDKYFNEVETRGISMPKFRHATEVIIFSDYSGERKEDNYFSYSFYIVEFRSILNATDEIFNLRNKESEWKDNSFIEYKKLNKDKVRRRILPQF
jgi:hypothetical protein